MKTKEELIALKNQVEDLSKKLAELNEEELMQVTGGSDYGTGPISIGSSRQLDIPASSSDTGTTSNENALPPDIDSRKFL